MKQVYLIGAALVMLLSTGCSKSVLRLNRSQPIEPSLPDGMRSPIGRAILPTSPLPVAAESGMNQSVRVPGYRYTLLRTETQRQTSPTTYRVTKKTVLVNGIPVDCYFDARGLPVTRPARRLTAAQLLSSVSDYLSQPAFD